MEDKAETRGQIPRPAGPIFKKILIPMCVLVIVETILLAASIFGGGVTKYLDQNSVDILSERVNNRKNYLENQMVQSWSQVTVTAQTINERAEAMELEGSISIGRLDESSDNCTPLILAVADELISLMRSNRVTGAFLIFNNEDLRDSARTGEYKSKPGIYLRDMDPTSGASQKNSDLLLERAPVAVVRELGISTDSGWQPRFNFDKDGYYPCLFEPYQAACAAQTARNGGTAGAGTGGDREGIVLSDLGYWSRQYTLFEDDKEAISYSVPLISEDGCVYGVLGVEITLDYFRRVLPNNELAEEKKGSYILGVRESGTSVFENVLISGAVYSQASEDRGITEVVGEDENSRNYIEANGERFYCTVEPLNLYNTNAPFSTDEWALIGAVRDQELFAFSDRIRLSLLAAILLTLLAGAVGSFLVSRMIAEPVSRLSKDMEAIRPAEMGTLARTGIAEIDKLADSIEKLSRDVIDSATKFAQIMEMASVKLAGFEIRRSENSLFITDGFFEIFRHPGVDTQDLDIRSFEERMQALAREYPCTKEAANEMLYQIPAESGEVYVKLTMIDDGERCIGLAEDVTAAIIEKRRLEHERDYDLLTGLINHRAFHRIMKELFEERRESLRTAALVMLDMDNLKQINDTYGHDCGDKFIRAAAECFRLSTPENAVVSRISGDEFYLFFYGFEGREEIRSLLDQLCENISSYSFRLPDQKEYRLHVSGGVAWYPSDSASYEELMRYSDFAMYKVKQSRKGQLSDFDIEAYDREAFHMQHKAEFAQLLEKQLVEYYFQPIVEVKTGNIFAYEALMRANLPTIKTPAEILALAREEDRLEEVESLTWFNAMAAFVRKIKEGKVDDHCRIFINSIANKIMPEEQVRRFSQKYAPYLHRIVPEVTEEEQVEEEMLRRKAEVVASWKGEMALDDYGSGYNSDKNLLYIAPKFIKVDMEIIRNIDKNADKQKIVENTVSYAKERGMEVIAEGVETAAELRTAIRLGVGYLQGYYLARPAAEPPKISDEVRAEILRER